MADNIVKFSSLLGDTVVSVRPIRVRLDCQVFLVTTSTGYQWICKPVVLSGWLGEANLAQYRWIDSVILLISQQAPDLIGYQTSRQQRFLAAYQTEWFHCIPYIRGHAYTVVTTGQAYQLGCLLAQLHALDLPKNQERMFPEIVFEIVSDGWDSALQSVMADCCTHYLYDFEHWITSHRDLHLGNVIWSSALRPQLIDWDSLGLIHPFIELIGLAVNCAGLANNQFTLELFTAVVLGYLQQAGCLLPADQTLWQLCYYTWFLWFSYCVNLGWHQAAEQTKSSILLLHQQMPVIQQQYARILESTVGRSAGKV